MKPLSIYLCLCALLAHHGSKAQLNADFASDITNGCSPIVVNYSDLSQGNPSEWRWDLGNGTISTLKNPSATYFAPGYYTIKLWIRQGNETDSIVKVNYINVFNSPSVNFIADITTGCNPQLVHFTDLTSIGAGNIISRQWDFGDGFISSEAAPQHVYTMPGNFNVTLKATAGNGCMGTLRRTSYIINKSVKSVFRSFAPNNCSPNRIMFQNESTGDGTLQYIWQFGDGTTSSDLAPVHIYSAAGAYTVKLIVYNDNGCHDTATKNLQVTMPVRASFTADKSLFCKAPANVQFTNTTVGASYSYWSFGDSSSSTLLNPLHQYSDTGSYTVKLVTKNSYGCADSLSISNYIRIQQRNILVPALPDSGCVPFTKSFSAVNLSHDTIISYTWLLDNEAQLQGQSQSYTFTNEGIYNISLVTVSSIGCSDTMLIPSAIKAGNQPVAAFSADLFNTCASTMINFTDQSSGDITSWEWDFGDQETSSEQNPGHVYLDTGWLTVSLTVRNLGCTDVAVHNNYVYIKPVVAKFKPAMECSEPYKRTFNNFSLGASRWHWNFGDGDTSVEFSPVHIYRQPGVYIVQLSAWNDSTGCMYISKKPVRIIDPVIDFSATDTVKCKKSSVTFNAVPNPQITRYIWEFGDGGMSSSLGSFMPHIYQNTGTYSVKLMARDSFDCLHTIEKINYIRIAGPDAYFGAATHDVCINKPSFFIDSTTVSPGNPVKKWEWNYGDGKRDTLFSPPFVHTYTSAGTFRPFIKVTDSLGCTDTFTFINPMRAGKVVPFFYISDSFACPGYSLRFVCPYSEPGVTYRWEFGDGQTSTRQIPYHSYSNEGVYTVKLFVSKINSCTDSMIISNAVRVKQTIADFTLSDSFSTCPPLLVGITDNSRNAAAMTWSFGDSTYTNISAPSHYYTYPGIYKISLIAKGPGACADTMQRTIVIKGPRGTFSGDRKVSCAPYNYNFTAHTENTTSIIWDFGDGATREGTDSFVHHLYADSGSFVPKVILKGADGCAVPLTARDTLTNIFIRSDFNFSDSAICTGETVLFHSSTQSNDSSFSVSWNFGDSSVATQQNSSHQYSTIGNYYPSLLVNTSKGCTRLFTSTAPVRVLPSPSITINTTGNGCAPLQVTCSASGSSIGSSITQWKWDMGNGDSSLLQTPPAVMYTSPGNYTITLLAVNNEGCTGTSQKTITAYASPIVNITGDSGICRGNSMSLHASGAATYKWLQPAIVSCDTCAVTTVQPQTNTLYIVTGTSANGCSNKDSFNVNVYQPFHLQYRQSYNMCRGKDKTLEARGADSYRWSPSYGLSSVSAPNPVATPDTSVEYMVIGSDNRGCFRDTGKVKVNVFAYPTVRACDDKRIMLGTPVDLDATYSADVTQVRWSPTDNLSRYDVNSIQVKPTENTEYTVKVTNDAGCEASDKVTVFVTCGKNNVFVPDLFSPNNDGINDIFYPRGTGLFKIQSLRVFNRWGQTVFEKKNFNANDPSAGWDGTFKGTKLMTDVFVYTIDLVCENNSVLSFHGNISLVQ